MRTNAIIRIICFSLAIVILSGILWAGLSFDLLSFGEQYLRHEDDKTLSPAATGGSEPDATASQEMTPVDQVITLGADQVRDIEVDWVAGNITILPDANATGIRFYENGVEAEKDRLVWELEGTTLSIEYCQDSISFPSFGFNVEISKDLFIYVPADWICNALEIAAASATVQIRGLTIGEFDFDGASGVCTLDNCNVTTLDLDTASGDVVFSGSLGFLDFDGVSANCTLHLLNCPSAIDMDGASGTLEITLPSDCGFTAKMGTLSGSFDCDFATTNMDGCHIHGDGRCQINVDAMSGKLCIHNSGVGCHQHESHHASQQIPCTEDPNTCTESHSHTSHHSK